jgi:hypothetical protein
MSVIFLAFFTLKVYKNAPISFTMSVPYLSAAAAKEISILMLWDIMLSHWASGLLIF